MIFRTVGLCALAAACVIAGAHLGFKEKRAARDLTLILSMLRHLEREISYRRADLPDCFRTFFALENHPAAEDLIAGRYGDALDAFSLSKALRARLSLFFSLLGKGEADEEKRRLDELIAELSPVEANAKKNASEKQRVCLTLGVCAGAVLLLLFL